jgi:hypothetical protein
MMELAALMPGSQARQAFQVFMHTLLARRVAAGPQPDARALRRTLQDAWQHPLVQRRWQRLALSLRESDCEHLVQLAVKRGLWGGEGRWLPRHAATEGWALDSRGHAAAVDAGAEPACADAPRRLQRDNALSALAGRRAQVQPQLAGTAGQAAL